MKENELIKKYGKLKYPEIKALLKKSQNKLSALKIKKSLIDNEIESVENIIIDIETFLSDCDYSYEDNTWLHNDYENVIFQDERQDIMNSFENKFGTENSLITGLVKYKIKNEISKKTNSGDNNENN